MTIGRKTGWVHREERGGGGEREEREYKGIGGKG